MPRPASPRPPRRITLARLALFAWLGFVVVASVGPFLARPHWGSGGMIVYTEGGTIAYLRDLSYQPGPGKGYTGSAALGWRPSAKNAIAFDARWGSRYHFFHFPPWIVLLGPTLLALTTHRLLRHRAARKLKKLGRTPCPACHYDATGLDVCPECGAAIEDHSVNAQLATPTPART